MAISNGLHTEDVNSCRAAAARYCIESRLVDLPVFLRGVFTFKQRRQVGIIPPALLRLLWSVSRVQLCTEYDHILDLLTICWQPEHWEVQNDRT